MPLKTENFKYLKSIKWLKRSGAIQMINNFGY